MNQRRSLLTLSPITRDNWRVPLAVREDQRPYVASATVTLARAYAFNAQNSHAVHICLDDEPIGMALWYDWPEADAYVLSEFFIDQRWQRQGYGLAAAHLVLEELRQEKRFPRVTLCYIPGNDAAPRLYEKLGFTHDPLADDAEEGDEICMSLML
ncbi:MAG: GNAT family N-acetyltransferase [Aristaeellaceae bacterium]